MAQLAGLGVFFFLLSLPMCWSLSEETGRMDGWAADGMEGWLLGEMVVETRVVAIGDMES
jgi:hypothetical protein